VQDKHEFQVSELHGPFLVHVVHLLLQNMSPDHRPDNIHTPYEKKALPHPDTCTNWLHQWLCIFLDKDLMEP
jgi:hypothetical protein